MKKLILLTTIIALFASAGCAAKTTRQQQREAFKAFIQDAHDACSGESRVNVSIKGREVNIYTSCIKKKDLGLSPDLWK